jgi:uncharacterized membrane protein
MPSKLLRLLKHRCWDERDTRRALDREALDRLQARIAASEQQHSAEIRVCVEASLPLSYLWRNASARERALALFGKLRVWDTEHNNGVLIYLLLVERRIELVADRGLLHRVDASVWQTLVEGMSESFKNRQFEAGLSQAVDQVSALLTQHFALAAGTVNSNELPDRPTLL